MKKIAANDFGVGLGMYSTNPAGAHGDKQGGDEFSAAYGFAKSMTNQRNRSQNQQATHSR